MKKIILITAIAAGTLFASGDKVQEPVENTVSINKCVGCHATDFSKAALGKSKIVKGQSLEEIRASLTGYRDGTYGGAMKGVMKGQVASYKDLDKLAEATFKATQSKE